MLSSPPPSPISYLFVDAGSLNGYLKNVSEKLFGGEKFSVDLAKIRAGYTRVFYYDALPVRERTEDEISYLRRIADQQQTLDAASEIDGVHVYEGDAHRRKRRGLEQKKVDVMIAVDMLTHTFRGNMQTAALLTGDNDFKPLLDALVREGMFVTLFYPPGETNKELINAADSRQPLNLDRLAQWLKRESFSAFHLPQTVNLLPGMYLQGEEIGNWSDDITSYRLLKQGETYIVRQDYNANTGGSLHISDENFELLRMFCGERGITVPPPSDLGFDWPT